MLEQTQCYTLVRSVVEDDGEGESEVVFRSIITHTEGMGGRKKAHDTYIHVRLEARNAHNTYRKQRRQLSKRERDDDERCDEPDRDNCKQLE